MILELTMFLLIVGLMCFVVVVIVDRLFMFGLKHVLRKHDEEIKDEMNYWK